MEIWREIEPLSDDCILTLISSDQLTRFFGVNDNVDDKPISSGAPPPSQSGKRGNNTFSFLCLLRLKRFLINSSKKIFLGNKCLHIIL